MPPPAPSSSADGGVPVIDQAAERVSALRRALEIQPDDSKLVGFAKILGIGLLAIVLLALSPLILVGLFIGLLAAA